VSTESIRFIFRVFPENNEQRDVPLSDIMDTGFYHFCSIISLIQSQWEEMRQGILNVLTFGTPIVYRLWMGISRSIDIINMHSDIRSTFDHFNLILLLFTRCFRHLLYTMDDHEFFNRSIFTMSDMSNMVSILRGLTFNMYMDGSDNQLREDMTYLLQQLYDRNCRKTFCNESVWLVDRSIYSILTVKVNTDDVMRNIPFVIPFNNRVDIFYNYIKQDRIQYVYYYIYIIFI